MNDFFILSKNEMVFSRVLRFTMYDDCLPYRHCQILHDMFYPHNIEIKSRFKSQFFSIEIKQKQKKSTIQRCPALCVPTINLSPIAFDAYVNRIQNRHDDADAAEYHGTMKRKWTNIHKIPLDWM